MYGVVLVYVKFVFCVCVCVCVCMCVYVNVYMCVSVCVIFPTRKWTYSWRLSVRSSLPVCLPLWQLHWGHSSPDVTSSSDWQRKTISTLVECFISNLLPKPVYTYSETIQNTSQLNTSTRSQINKDHAFFPLKWGHLFNKDISLGTIGALFKEVPLYVFDIHVHVRTWR